MPSWAIQSDPVRRSDLDTEYVRRQVTVTLAGAPYNPTADVVVMAFTVVGTDPVVGDWKTASWETINSAGSLTYWVRALVGPSGGVITLTRGDWQMWAKITDSPEVPVMPAGILTIT